jgi:hypothetical protein
VKIFLHDGRKMTKKEAAHFRSCHKCSSRLAALKIGTAVATAVKAALAEKKKKG